MKKLIMIVTTTLVAVIAYGYWDKSRRFIADDIEAVAKIEYRDDDSGFLDMVITFENSDPRTGVQAINYIGNLYIDGKMVDSISGLCDQKDSNVWLHNCVVATKIPEPEGRFRDEDFPKDATRSHTNEGLETWVESLSLLDKYEIHNEKVVIWKSYRPLRYIRWLDGAVAVLKYPFSR